MELGYGIVFRSSRFLGNGMFVVLIFGRFADHTTLARIAMNAVVVYTTQYHRDI